jgi:hypothetical protein
MTVPTTSNYPTSLDDASTLFNSYDQKTFTLNGAIDSTTTTITVDESLTGISPYFFLAFETGEICYVTAVNVGSFQFTADRGINGNNQSHADGETCRLILTSHNLEQLKDAIIAIQTELGTTPKATASDVGDRIYDVEQLITTHDHSGVGSVQVDADTVDNFHAYSTATANHLLALDANGDLPTDITGDADTLDGQHGSYYGIKGNLVLDAGSELTISGGLITVTDPKHVVDTQADASTDDLDTISGGSTGDVIVISPADAARTIVVKNGTGNIVTTEGYDIHLFDTDQHMILRYDGTNWKVIGGNYPKKRTYSIVLGNQDEVLNTGVHVDDYIQSDMYVVQYKIISMVSGSCQIDLWADVYASGFPTDADSQIVMTLTTSSFASTNITPVTLTADDLLRWNVDSATTVTQVTVILTYYGE